MNRKPRKGPRSHLPKKSEKIVHNLTKTILQYTQGKRFTPSTLQELMQDLDIASAHTLLFKEILDHLVAQGKLSHQNGRYLQSKNTSLVTGAISVHKKGFGFVKTGNGPDVFIPKHSMQGAVDGDTVEIEVNPHISEKGPEGVIIAILKRSRSHLAVIIIRKEGHHFLAHSALLGPKKHILVMSKEPLAEGDRIICKVLDWSSDPIEAALDRKIGHISDPSIDIQAAIEEFGLPDGFTVEAIQEAKTYGGKVTKTELLGRKDLTSWECVTIDPTTARDYDDAISLTQDERGHFHLGVHIADVAHYVKPGMHLDQEAFTRCNSTYFPGTCVPMLPEELSNDLCSLKQGVIRLTQSVFAEFDTTGTLVHWEIGRSAIKSRKRFTYEEAFEILEGKKKSPHAPLLKRMVELCHLLKKKRFERGSIDFSMPDNVLIVDKEGKPLKIERIEYDITHQMIEEFMLKANELVAIHLQAQGKTLIYRVHEQPSSDSYQDFYAFARSLGFQLPAIPTHKDIQKLFQEAKDSPLLPQLSVSFIRSMRLAAYSPDNIGHYGLALEHYCHFTSPIRRYTDLIIQRLLTNELPPDTDLDAVSAACSEKERISFRAESSVKVLKKLRLAAAALHEDPAQTYPALITRVKPFSLFFEVPQFDLEGSLHISEIGRDFYEYNEATMQLRGRRTGQTYTVGQPIQVHLTRVDLSQTLAEWQLHHEKASPQPLPNKRRRKHR